MNTRSKNIAIILGSLMTLSLSLVPSVIEAAGTLTNRSVQLSSSANAATGVTYTVSLTGSTATTVKSIQVVACTTAFGTCTAPTNFNWNAATNPSSVSANVFGGPTTTNWVIGSCPAQTTNLINYTYSANAAAGNTAGTIALAGVTNPNTSNTTFYLRITTFSAANCATTLDTGNVTFAVTDTIQVQGTVQEQLTFCVYTSSCGGGVVNPVSLSTGTNCTANAILQTANACTGTSKFDIFTNGQSGASVYYTGTAFTNQNSPGNSFSALGNGVTLSSNTEQFGIQCAGTVIYNTTNCPAVGATASYNLTANTVLGTIAGGTSSTGNTVTYNANIATSTKPGIYKANITYSATATF